MNTKVVLAELKCMYELASDIVSDGELDDKDKLSLKVIKLELERLYGKIYEDAVDKVSFEIENDRAIADSGHDHVTISSDVSLDYVCTDDEDDDNVYFKTCGDLSYYWYDDIDYLNKEEE